MKNKLTQLLLLVFVQIGSAQIMEITHQSNGTILQLPIESIDSVRFNSYDETILKTVYQNNGNILGLAVQDIDSITYVMPEVSLLPTLFTSAVTEQSSNSVISGGFISSDGGSTIIQRGVCWNTMPNPTIANNYTSDGTGTGEFISSVLPLNPSTTYYIRAYATNDTGTAYGNELTFTTSESDESADLPSVVTSEISYDDGLTALGGGMASIANGSITSRGLCWAVGSTPTIDSSHLVEGDGAGDFSGTLEDLLPDTIYKVRAFAVSDAGVAYGEEVTFKTYDYPSIFRAYANFVYKTSASIELAVLFDGYSNITERGICWSTDQTPTLENNFSVIGSGEGYFHKILTNLSPNTVYYVRPFATNGVGTSYGPVLTIQTTNSIANLDDLYAKMYLSASSRHDDFGQKGVDIFTDMVSGDMALSNSAYGWYNQTANLVATIDDSNEVNKMISMHYTRMIHASNAVINSLTPFGTIPSNNEERWALGQAMALRAHSYFYLSQCFQEDYDLTEMIFPLFDGTLYDQTLVDMAVIYDFIETDLLDAIALLGNYNRPTKTNIDSTVAQGILAYTYAAKGDYALAQEMADVVINAGYPLTSLNELAFPGEGSGFNNLNTGSWIWGVDLTEEMDIVLINWWGKMDYFSYSYAAAGDTKSIDDLLYSQISPNDIRLNQFDYGTAQLQPLNKFFDPERIFFNQRVITTDLVFNRVDEFYLLAAECAANLNDENTAKARLVQVLSDRLGGAENAIAYVDQLSGQELLDAIYLQTRIELWGEGKSYLAMKRYNSTVTRGTNHVFRAGESFAHDSDELTFEYKVNYNEYTPPALESLDCDAVVVNDTESLVLNKEVVDFTFEIPYISEAGGDYDSLEIASTNVNGLVASLEAGTFNTFNGTLTFNVTGTPLNYGTAYFFIRLGGQLCTVSLEVLAFENCTAYETILSIDFDDNPEETYWELYSTSDQSNPIFSGGIDGEYANMTSIVIPFCLDEGDYVLSFFDTNGNGLDYTSYASGSNAGYTLYDLDGNTYACGGAFDYQEINYFTSGISRNVSLPEGFMTGYYNLTTITPGVYNSVVFANEPVYIQNLNSCNTAKQFSSLIYPDLIPNISMDFRFNLNLETNSIEVSSSQSTGVGCGESITLGPATDLGVFDPNDDSSFNIIFTDDQNSSCGNPITVEILFTKINESELTDDDGDGFSEFDGDCDDTNASIFPGAPEVQDGIDNDCDGILDNCVSDLAGVYSVTTTYGSHDFLPSYSTNTQNQELVGLGNGLYFIEDFTGGLYSTGPYATSYGTSATNAQISENCGSISWSDQSDPWGPIIPQIDGVNSVDANGVITISWLSEAHGENGVSVYTPLSSEDNDADGFTPFQGDCDDTNSSIYPGAIEIEDGIDNDCDGEIDEGFPINIGMVGSAVNNWGTTPDIPLSHIGNGVYQATVTFIDGQIKFRLDNNWTNNWGDTGLDGILDADGNNIDVSAGEYIVTINRDLGNNYFDGATYTIVPGPSDCPIAAPFTGDFTLTTVATGIFDSVVLVNGTVTITEGETPTDRVISVATYPEFGAFPAIDFQFSLVCGNVVVPSGQATGVGCGSSTTLGPAAELGTYDPSDDSSFNIIFADDEGGASCGAEYAAEITLTKI